MECTTSGKSKGHVESSLKPSVTYRPQHMKKSTSCLGGCSERRGSAVSRFDLIFFLLFFYSLVRYEKVLELFMCPCYFSSLFTSHTYSVLKNMYPIEVSLFLNSLIILYAFRSLASSVLYTVLTFFSYFFYSVLLLFYISIFFVLNT